MICDFGLARVTSVATTLDNMKFRDIGGFSPRYAAPEVLANAHLGASTDPEVDKKSDVYSFAIIIWELLTRKVPWNGLKREEIEISVRRGVRVSASFPCNISLAPRSILFYCFLFVEITARNACC